MKTPTKKTPKDEIPEGTVWVLVPEKVKGTLNDINWHKKLVNAEEAETQLSLPDKDRNYHWQHVKYAETETQTAE